MRMGTGRWAQRGEISGVLPVPPETHTSFRQATVLSQETCLPVSWPTGEAEAGHSSDRGGEDGTRGGS